MYSMAASNNTAANPSTLLPLELVDKCIGSRMHMTMKNDREVRVLFHNKSILCMYYSSSFNHSAGKHDRASQFFFYIIFI